MGLFSRRKKALIEIITEYQDGGVSISIEKSGERLDIPLRLSITELRQLKNLDELQLIEDLYADEAIYKTADGAYQLSYDQLYQLDEVARKLLNIPKVTPVSMELDNESFIGANDFNFIAKIHTEKYKNIHRMGKRTGAIITLPTNERFLLEEPVYELLSKIDLPPNREDVHKLATYIAEIKQRAQSLDIPLNDYLAGENYEFIDSVDIDVARTKDGIEMLSNFNHESLAGDLLTDISNANSKYTKAKDKRIFVSDKAFETKEKIDQLDIIENKDIPKMVQNPTAFIPEEIDIPLDLFSDRVKSLGIRVYKAQPTIHGGKNEHGWFDVDFGLEVKDVEGNSISKEGMDFFEGSEGDYKQIDENTFVEMPEKLDDLRELFAKVKEESRNHKSPHPQLSNLILEIFENFTHVEYNKPLINLKEAIVQDEIFESKPPSTFQAILKPFQVDGFKWMKTLRLIGNGGLLADDMGLGKTIQVIAYLTYLHEQKQLTPTLLVLPKSLIDNWVNELRKFAPDISRNMYVHTGPNRIKDPELISQYDIVLTTYTTLARDQTKMAIIDWEMVICDEAQNIKNPTTANSVAVKALKNKGRLALTGTPVENNLTELWSILDFVQPGILGSLQQFKAAYETRLRKEEITVDAVQEDIEEKIKYVYKRRLKSDELVNEIPDKTEHPPVLVQLGREQKNLYASIVEQVKDKQLSGLQAIQQLKMICSHPGLYSGDLKQIKANRVPKLEATISLIKNIKAKKEKVLIFTEFIEMQAILKKEILNTFNLNAEIINGSTGYRQLIVDEFNNKPGFDVLILSPKAAGTGLTITGANHVIHYTRWWNPAVENQATDRVYRIGQEKDVHVYYPIVALDGGKKSVEEIINEILDSKKSLAENVIVPSSGESIEKETLKEMAL